MDTPNDSQVTEIPETMRGQDREECLRMLEDMLRIRHFEEQAARAYTQGKISGFLHLYIGQEAIAVGTREAMKPGDRIVATYRSHGHALALGCDPAACAGELLGKETGLVGGVGGSMHFFDREKGAWGGYAIIGSHVPVAAGHAFAAKYEGSKEVTLCFLGDGAVGIGPTHEGMTLAGLWKLPIVFVVENNRYSMGTPLSRTVPVEDITSRAPGYGMHSDRFVVTDPFQVRDRLSVAIERARATQEPSLLELLTYRFRGHSMSDPGKYRTKEELDKERSRDAVEKLRLVLQEEHNMSEYELDALDERVFEVMSEAYADADAAAFPAPERRFDNMYVEEN